jgi:hypothetical protein
MEPPQRQEGFLPVFRHPPSSTREGGDG